MLGANSGPLLLPLPPPPPSLPLPLLSGSWGQHEGEKKGEEGEEEQGD